MTFQSRSVEIRAGLDHPVIDADGHTIEYLPALQTYLRREAVELDLGSPFIQVSYPGLGDGTATLGSSPTWNQSTVRRGWYELSDEERAHYHVVRPAWRGAATRDTRDFATAMIPALMYERLEQFGIDFAVVYPTAGLGFIEIEDERKRRGACRALNRYHADVFAGLRDRLEPVAAVPMHTPEEAVEELELAVELGFKAILVPSWVRRPTPFVKETAPAVARYAQELDTFGIDSAFDYDPFWKRCIELRVSPATHSPSLGIGTRRSTSNYMYNHIGHFAAAGEAFCKSLFFGGVTHRFPELRVAFLEGGVHWAAALLFDLVARWEKRNKDAIETNYAPENLDPDLFGELFRQYAAPVMRSAAPAGSDVVLRPRAVHPREVLDEFAACGIVRREDIPKTFVPNFFFGCEADDAMVSTAFGRCGRLPSGVTLNAMFSSDIGHWDVPDMSVVLEEAWEHVEDGVLSRDEFRAFTFENAARFYLDSNPSFFEGTVLAREVAVR